MACQNAEREKAKCWAINCQGTINIAQAVRYCDDIHDLPIPLVYLSTDYIFNGTKGQYVETDIPDPINFYALSKLIGEIVVQSTTDHYLIIRTSFKPRPWKHPQACTDMYTSADYVDIIASEIAQVVEHYPDIKNFSSDCEILHIGTGRKSVYDLAVQTKPDVGKTTRVEIEEATGLKLPEDTSLDSTTWKIIKHNLLDSRRMP